MSREPTATIVWKTEALASPTAAEVDLLASVLAEIVRDMQALIEAEED